MVPRRDAEPRRNCVALPLPAGGVPVRDLLAPRTRDAASTTASTSCSTPASSTTTATGRRGRLREGGPTRPAAAACASPTPGPRRRRSTCCRRLVPQHLVVGRRVERPASGDARRTVRPSVERTRSLGDARAGISAPAGPDGDAAGAAVLRQRDERAAALRLRRPRLPYPKDGINDHVVHGAPTVNPDGRGTKAAFWYQADGRAGRDRRAAAAARVADRRGAGRPTLGATSTTSSPSAAPRPTRSTPSSRPPAMRRRRGVVMRQALRGDAVDASSSTATTSRAGSTATRRSPRRRPSRQHGRNARLAALRLARHHLDARQVGVPVVRGLGPGVPLRRAGARRSGVRQVPAAAALPGVVPAPERRAAGVRVGLRRRQPAGPGMGGARGLRDRRATRLDFLAGSSTSCWSTSPGGSTAEDADGSNLFEGGFLGLDNIGPIDRDHLPVGGLLEQSDATAWMAFYTLPHGHRLVVAGQARTTHAGPRPQVPRALRTHPQRPRGRGALGRRGRVLLRPLEPGRRDAGADQGALDGGRPAGAGQRGRGRTADPRSETLGKGFSAMLERSRFDLEAMARRSLCEASPVTASCCSGSSASIRVERLLRRLFDESEFLSPYGLRALSASLRDHPYVLEVGDLRATIDYEPAESTTDMFGGNSNWRGPIWFPLNYLLVSSIKVSTAASSATTSRSSTRPDPGRAAQPRRRSPRTCDGG